MLATLLPLLIAMGTGADSKPPALRYLALGDSYTIGESVPEAQRWPVLLAQRLLDDGIVIAAPRIIARTGWTTDELSDAMDRAKLDPPYDLVSLLIGVNNQYRGRDAGQYRQEFTALLKRAIDLAGGRADRVFVLSIPDWGVTPFGTNSGRDVTQIARELDAYNAINRDVSRALSVAWVDITGISRDTDQHTDPARFRPWRPKPGTANTQAPNLVADDGLHPSGLQYALWVEATQPVVRGLLQKP